MEVRDNEEMLVQALIDSIHAGDIHTAQCTVGYLANLHLKLNISIVEEQDQILEKPFKVTVQVEDRESSGASFQLLVKSSDKIEDLKKRVNKNFNFPIEVQRWIIGKRIQDDKATLAKCGVRTSSTVFLYLLPARTVGLRHENESFESVANLLDFAPIASSLHPGKSLYDLNNTLLATGACKPDLDGEKLYLPEKEDNFQTAWEEGEEENEIDTVGNEDFIIGDRVIWPSDHGPEKGTVRWVGTLPDMEGDQITVGIEFDNKVGVGDGKYKTQQLFHTKFGHANLLSVMDLHKDKSNGSAA